MIIDRSKHNKFVANTTYEDLINRVLSNNGQSTGSSSNIIYVGGGGSGNIDSGLIEELRNQNAFSYLNVTDGTNLAKIEANVEKDYINLEFIGDDTNIGTKVSSGRYLPKTSIDATGIIPGKYDISYKKITVPVTVDDTVIETIKWQLVIEKVSGDNIFPDTDFNAIELLNKDQSVIIYLIDSPSVEITSDDSIGLSKILISNSDDYDFDKIQLIKLSDATSDIITIISGINIQDYITVLITSDSTIKLWNLDKDNNLYTDYPVILNKTLYVKDTVQLNNAYLGYDDKNNAVYVYRKKEDGSIDICNFYATGEITAYGAGSGSDIPATTNYLYELKDVNNGAGIAPSSPDTMLMWDGTTWAYISKNDVGLNESLLEAYLTSKEYIKKSDTPDLNVGSATKLLNSRNLWGRPFDGTTDVIGSLIDVENIDASGLITADLGFSTTSYILIGDGKICWDSEHNALYVIHKNGTDKIHFYSMGDITAYGASSDSGGSGSSDILGIKVNGQIFVPEEGYITIPDYPTELSWENISNKPSWITNTKPTYSFGEITNKPTTLAGYGITDGVTSVEVNGTGNAVTNATVNNRKLVLTKSDVFFKRFSSLVNNINANTLTSLGIYLNETGNGIGNSNFPSTYGILLNFPTRDIENYRMQFHSNSNGKLFHRIQFDTSSNFEWNQIAYITDNVASASKLETKRTIWGQPFDGTLNVSGSITGATTINASDAVIFGSTLSVAGLITATTGLTTPQYIQIGDGRIYWDSTNKALYVKYKDGSSSVNFYSTGEITAYGSGDISPGGGDSNFFGIKVNGSTYRVDDDGFVTIPDYPTSLTWSDITGKPSWIGNSKPSYTWSEITNKPKTLTGYGITDAYKVSAGDPDDNKGMIAGYYANVGSYASFVQSNYGGQFSLGAGGVLRYRGVNANVAGSWKQVAFITDTVAAADKLTTNAGSNINPIYFTGGVPKASSYSFGNASGNIPISNGTLCANLNADKVDGIDVTINSSATGIKKLYVFGSAAASKTYIKLGTLPTVSQTASGSSKVKLRIYGGINFAGREEATWEVIASTRGKIYVESTLINGAKQLKIGYVSKSTGVEIWAVFDDNYITRTAIEIEVSEQFTVAMTRQSTKPSGFTEGNYRLLLATGTDGILSVSGIKDVERITFAEGDNGRKTVITNGGSFMLYAATSGWAGGVSYFSNDGSTSLGTAAGGYGSGNVLNYYFYGGVYNSPKMVILSSGNVGIGTTAPTQKLHVVGNILATGEITAYSDIRLKSNIKPLIYRGRLNPKTYIKDNKLSIGFIALEVLELYPELVLETNNDNNYLSLNYGNITAVLSSLINKVEDEVELLKSKIDRLEKENKELKEILIK